MDYGRVQLRLNELRLFQSQVESRKFNLNLLPPTSFPSLSATAKFCSKIKLYLRIPNQMENHNQRANLQVYQVDY